MISIPKNLVYAIFSGLLMALSWPTYGFPLLLFVAWVPLLLLEHEISISDNVKRKAWKIFGWSYLCFFIFNIITIHWLWQVAINKVGAFVPTVVLNALLMSFFFMIYHWMKKETSTQIGLFLLPFIWITFEKIHLNWELNWPWLNLGNVFADYHQWVQWYEITGTLGGTLWILAVNALLFYYYKIYLVTRKKSYVRKIVGLALITILIPIAISYIMYGQQEGDGESMQVCLLQPEVDPYSEKYNRTSSDLVSQLGNYIEKVPPETQLIIGPETSFPGSGELNVKNLEREPYVQYFQDVLRDKNAVFITGTDTYEIVDGPGDDVNYSKKTGIYFKRYNSCIQIEPNQSSQLYFKSKLVPMVEYFSYQNILKPLLGDAILDFGGSTNSLARPLVPKVFRNSLNQAKIAPTVCYESVFGEYTAAFVKQGANLISISTNDSWWQDSQGHKQLLVYSKLRAIENRRYIVRSANSGISAIINSKGDIIASKPYLEEGVLYGQAKLLNQQTSYTKNGDYLATIAMLILGIALGYIISRIILKYVPSHKKTS